MRPPAAAMALALLCMACAAQPAAAEPQWIWFPEGNPRLAAPEGARYFARDFSLDALPDSAMAELTADNQFEFFINGIPAAEGDAWQQVLHVDALPHLRVGTNTLAVAARNQGGAAGLLAGFLALFPDGRHLRLGTDAAWRAADAPGPSWPRALPEGSPPALALGAPPCVPWESVGPVGRAVRITIENPTFSPNNDGLRDEAAIHFQFIGGKPGAVQASIRGKGGPALRTLAAADKIEGILHWDGRDSEGQALNPGRYTCSVVAAAGLYTEVEEHEITLSRAASLAAPAKSRMHQVFPIGIWYDGRVEGINCAPGYHDVPRPLEEARAYYETTFRDIKNHEIDLVVIPNTPPPYRRTLLDTAAKAGVRVVLEVAELAWPEFGDRLSLRHPNMIEEEAELRAAIDGIIAPFRDHPALFAYQLIDEPPASMFPRWQLVKRILGDLDPKHPAFSALCFENELHRTSRMGTEMIVFDRYPLTPAIAPGKYDWGNWVRLCGELDKHAQANGVPYWMVVQACAKPDALRFPTPAELRCFVWLSLACNSKGIFYFLYNSETQEERLQGLVDTDLNPVPLFDEVRNISAHLHGAAPLILNLAPSQDYGAQAEAPLMARPFRHAETGKRHVIVCNTDVLEGIGIEVVWSDDEVRVTPSDAPGAAALPPGGGTILAAP